MVRDFFLAGETMVAVKGRSDSIIPVLTQLGLSDAEIRITAHSRYEDMNVDTFGRTGVGSPPDVQYFLSYMDIDMTLIHFDATVLRFCIQESTGGMPFEGIMPHAGSRLGNGVPRFSPAGTINPSGVATGGNHLIGLNLVCPVAPFNWRFWYCYLQEPTVVWPIGTTKSIVQLSWRAVPYVVDPWGEVTTTGYGTLGGPGQGSYGIPLYDHTLDV